MITLLKMMQAEWHVVLRDEREGQGFLVKTVLVLSYFGIALYSLKFK